MEIETKDMLNFAGNYRAVSSLLVTLLLPLLQAAQLDWTWEYADVNGTITASGVLTTEDVSDEEGFYNITSMSGERNGVAIANLTEVGEAVPGNEPFAIDNAIREGTDDDPSQLRSAGIGLILEDGNYLNPYYASWETSYIEVYSVAPFLVNFSNFGPEDGYEKVDFTAVIVTADGGGIEGGDAEEVAEEGEQVEVDEGSTSGSTNSAKVWFGGTTILGSLALLL